jgi:hypothetical protein
VPGVRGAFGLDPSTLFLVRGSQTDQDGLSRIDVPPAGGDVFCQTLTLGAHGLELSQRWNATRERAAVAQLASALQPLGTGGPPSPFLFDRSDRDIAETLVHDRQDPRHTDRVLRGMRRAAFDRTVCEDLADQVGTENSLRILHEVWRQAMLRKSERALASALHALIDQKEDEWHEVMFPTGVPADDPFWGEIGVMAGCSDTETVTKSGHRIKQKSGVTNLFVYVSTWGNVTHYTGSLIYTKSKADSLTVNGTGTATLSSSYWEDIPFKKTKSDEKKITANVDWFGHGLFSFSCDSSASVTDGGTTLTASTCQK